MDHNKLTRSTTDQIIGGVCGGLARYMGIDSTLMRAIFVVTALLSTGFPVVLLYIVLWMIMPREPVHTPPPQQHTPTLPPQQDPTGEWQYDPYTGERLPRSDDQPA
jgi:phage shock protein C